MNDAGVLSTAPRRSTAIARRAARRGARGRGRRRSLGRARRASRGRRERRRELVLAFSVVEKIEIRRDADAAITREIAGALHDTACRSDRPAHRWRSRAVARDRPPPAAGRAAEPRCSAASRSYAARPTRRNGPPSPNLVQQRRSAREQHRRDVGGFAEHSLPSEQAKVRRLELDCARRALVSASVASVARLCPLRAANAPRYRRAPRRRRSTCARSRRCARGGTRRPRADRRRWQANRSAYREHPASARAQPERHSPPALSSRSRARAAARWSSDRRPTGSRPAAARATRASRASGTIVSPSGLRKPLATLAT